MGVDMQEVWDERIRRGLGVIDAEVAENAATALAP
jgi:hypothetical protein